MALTGTQVNVQDVKKHGVMLGLEAELNAQGICLTNLIKDREWLKAATHAANIKQLLDELHFTEQLPTKPCALTSPNKNLKSSSTASKDSH